MLFCYICCICRNELSSSVFGYNCPDTVLSLHFLCLNPNWVSEGDAGTGPCFGDSVGRSGRTTFMLFLAWPLGKDCKTEPISVAFCFWLTLRHKILTALIPGSGGSARAAKTSFTCSAPHCVGKVWLGITWDTWHPLVIHNTQGRPHLPRGLLLLSFIPQLLPLVWNINTIPVHLSIPSLPSLPFVSPTSASLGRRSSDRWHPAAAVAMVISDKHKHHPRSIDCSIRRMQDMEIHSWKFRPSHHKSQEWSLSKTH